ncbi:aromatic amino acid transaminase [Inhella sp.]|uniref:amino acid aminotransferase n=1 Tax=Inhella sp. TaxID=1921806 RepID=UPI0035B07965
MFEHIPPYAGDPILSLNEAFQKDPRPHKVNLSIGLYFDEQGRIPMPASVAEAERRVVARAGSRPYLPMEGAANFRAAVQELLFGGSAALQEKRIATIQGVGSSGGLRVGADFLKAHFPASPIYLSTPTWDNHRAVFEGAGLEVRAYPYYDASTGGLDFAGLLAALEAAPARSVVLLHACCHNPTGVDLSAAQWHELAVLLKRRELLAFLDLAYQGYGDGLQEDLLGVKALLDAGLLFFLANSFSKNMSVYGERCGALSVVCESVEAAERVLGQLKFTIRRNYSNPPTHGGQLVATVLLEADLRAQWEQEVTQMRQRIQAMRRRLHEVLSQKLPGRDFGYFLSQRGMFSYTGLSAEQAERLKAEHAVYILRSGRMCVAGLNEGNVQAVAEAMATVLG